MRNPMSRQATGTFNVQLRPQPADDHADGATQGRMTIDKQFDGDLQGVSIGQMLTGMGSVKGSAGYVAIERVTGTLEGRQGSFMLQHSGTSDKAVLSLSVSVIPDSATDALTGLAGTMMIHNVAGQHSYTFDYTLPSGESAGAVPA